MNPHGIKASKFSLLDYMTGTPFHLLNWISIPKLQVSHPQ